MPSEPNGSPKRVERYRDNQLVRLDAIVCRLNDDCDDPVGIEETHIERSNDWDYIQYKSDVQEETYRILWFSDLWTIDRASAFCAIFLRMEYSFVMEFIRSSKCAKIFQDDSRLDRIYIIFHRKGLR